MSRQIFPYIQVKFRFEGFHYWKNAPEPHGYLSQPHRHMFHVTASKPVTHDNRDVEFIQLRRSMFNYCQEKWGVDQTGEDVASEAAHGASCEEMARDLLTYFELDDVLVEEDGENGGGVYAIDIPDDEPKKENSKPASTIKDFGGRIFRGFEAEGPLAGMPTIFVPAGQLNRLEDIVNEMSELHSPEMRNLYLGAGNEPIKRINQISQIIRHLKPYCGSSLFSHLTIETYLPDQKTLQSLARLMPNENTILIVLLDADDVEEIANPEGMLFYHKVVDTDRIYWKSPCGQHVYETMKNDPLFSIDELFVFESDDDQ